MEAAHDSHAVLTARHQLREVADAYDTLAEIALNGPDPHALANQRRERAPEPDPNHVGSDGKRLGSVTFRTAATRAGAHLGAIDARMDIAAWATFLARAVMDARNHERAMIQAAADGMRDGAARDEMQALADAARPWRPRSTDPASLLREIAADHLGALVATDPLEAADFRDSCLEYVRMARRQAWPSGARWVRLHVPCPEAGTDDLGRRVPCPGEYRMWMRPDQDALGDMVCDLDRQHRITPEQWFAAMRRKPVDQAAAARLARVLRVAGPSASA